ncbi:hypothetical protein HYC85_002513 [Camellia sinensis]|uniref:Major facilitator superfamily (MFS) profile domain-containing protein n=1 Tax=Camellia sinensis TaxID=4442 RepID=A0A7J7IA87_CAMSI|nr:hypothetical protein HYC85_002513 [Camellia sinensis]
MEKPSGESTGINTFACACAVVGSMIAIIFGYDTGVMSGANIFIKEDLKISDSQVEILVGILNMCALVGALCAGRTSDYIGRRYTIVLASIIFMVGSILMGYGPNYAILMLGRCIAGIGVGFALMISPVYSAEISSNSTRGILGSLTEMGISIGILLGYISNYVFARLTLKVGWRVMLGIAAIPSLALALGILKMPESPRWLIMQGRLRDGKQILDQVCNTKEDAEARFRDIKVRCRDRRELYRRRRQTTRNEPRGRSLERVVAPPNAACPVDAPGGDWNSLLRARHRHRCGHAVRPENIQESRYHQQGQAIAGHSRNWTHENSMYPDRHLVYGQSRKETPLAHKRCGHDCGLEWTRIWFDNGPPPHQWEARLGTSL